MTIANNRNCLVVEIVGEFFLTFEVIAKEFITIELIQEFRARPLMLLRVIFILTVCFATSSISKDATPESNSGACAVRHAAILPSENRASLNITSGQAKPGCGADRRVITSDIKIIDGQLFLSPSLQRELEREINAAQKSLSEVSKFLGRKIEAKIGLVYIHQGYENWRLQFTYGGYLLETNEIAIATTDIWELKQVFSQTKLVEIRDKTYQTTQYLTQLGPILHESRT